jgi:DNA-binding NtrC family response regulator
MSKNFQTARTILIVDDQDVPLEFCRATLTMAGYSVLTAANAEQALRWFQTGQSSIAVALIDVVMPGMSGIALAERITEDHPETKIVLMSGYSPEEVKRIVGGDGARYRSMWKPFEAETLVQMIRNVLGEPPGAPSRGRAKRAGS